MSNVLARFGVRNERNKYWMILDCGHWYKWDGLKPPRVGGKDFPCPDCAPVPKVVENK